MAILSHKPMVEYEQEAELSGNHCGQLRRIPLGSLSLQLHNDYGDWSLIYANLGEPQGLIYGTLGPSGIDYVMVGENIPFKITETLGG